MDTTRYGTLHDVRICRTLGSDIEMAKCFVPSKCQENNAVPLLVALHEWSNDYMGERNLRRYFSEAEQREWAFVFPDFCGQNNRPEACASTLALNDVKLAVEFMKEYTCIDDKRIFLVGASGGGHMALMSAASFPHIWAAVSAWVPITDLAAWYRQVKTRNLKYTNDLEAICGGPPGTSAEIDREYTARSPVNHLYKAAGLNIDINAGILDGHTGSVPVSHSLNAFNLLAEANGAPEKKITQEQIDKMTAAPDFTRGLSSEYADHEKEGRDRRILFRRSAGPVRVTIFEGGHEIDIPAALRWLSEKKRSC